MEARDLTVPSKGADDSLELRVDDRATRKKCCEYCVRYRNAAESEVTVVLRKATVQLRIGGDTDVLAERLESILVAGKLRAREAGV